jgi:HlyD family type I secretion membrane fusion protein
VRLTEEELATNNGLIDRGYVPRRRAFELGRALADLKGRRAELAADLAEATKQIEHSELEIGRVCNSFAEAVETEFQEVEKSRIELLERVQLVTRRLEDLKIRAPLSGVVVNMAVHTLQGVVALGASILEIVPEDDPLVFEVQISPRDINDVKMGMSAIVHLPGREQVYPDGLKATLETVSADSMIDPLSGRAYYLARLRATPGDPVGSGADLKPGMPVDVLLLRGSRTLHDYLVAPLSDLLTQLSTSLEGCQAVLPARVPAHGAPGETWSVRPGAPEISDNFRDGRGGYLRRSGCPPHRGRSHLRQIGRSVAMHSVPAQPRNPRGRPSRRCQFRLDNLLGSS